MTHCLCASITFRDSEACPLVPGGDRIENGDIDPAMVITHRMPFADAAKGYDIFLKKEDNCEKVVLKA